MGKEFARSEGIRVEVTNEQSKQIRNLYKELSDEYKERLRILSTKETVSARMREQYLKDYVKDLERDIQYLNNNLENTITSNMLRVAEAVVDDSMKLDKEMGFGGIMTKQFYIPQDAVAVVTSGELYKGKWTLSGAIWGTNQKQLDDINSIVAKGIAGNKSAMEIAKDLDRYVNPQARKEWNWGKVYPNTSKKVDYNAQRLARTMVSHAYQESFVESTKDNPFIESYRWLASGGDRMCPVCEERDGQIYDKDNLPMDHPNGMCTFEVVIEKSYEEIGRDLADWVNGEGDEELNHAIDQYADSLGFNVKQMTAGTEQVRKAEAEKVVEEKKIVEFIPTNAKEFEEKWNIPVSGLKGKVIKNFDTALTYIANEFGVNPKDFITMIDNKNPATARNYSAYYYRYDQGIHVHKNYAKDDFLAFDTPSAVHEIIHALNDYLSKLETGKSFAMDETANKIVSKVFSENGYVINSRTGLPSKEDVTKAVSKYGSTNSRECLAVAGEQIYGNDNDIEGYRKSANNVNRGLMEELKSRLNDYIK